MWCLPSVLAPVGEPGNGKYPKNRGHQRQEQTDPDAHYSSSWSKPDATSTSSPCVFFTSCATTEPRNGSCHQARRLWPVRISVTPFSQANWSSVAAISVPVSFNFGAHGLRPLDVVDEAPLNRRVDPVG